MRRHAFPVLALALAICVAGGCSEEPTSPSHVILITIDTLRADHLGLYGYPRPTTPFLDRLGRESVVFEHAYSSSSHTAPSHASLLTSLQPAQHRLLQNGEGLNPEIETLANVFHRAGYRTAAFTAVSFLRVLGNGFNDFVTQRGIQPAETILGAARQWIDDQEPRTPLFVWIHLFDVHEWHADPHLDAATVEAMRQEAPNGEDLLRFLVREHGVRSEGLDRPRVLDAVLRYDGQLRSVDREIGRFYTDLQSDGFLEDALWIITADHGEGLGNHGAMGHGIHIYNEQLHVPLIVHSPGSGFAPRRVSEPVGLVDVVPTLVDWLGVRWQQTVAPAQGRSFLPLLTGRNPERPVRDLFAQRRPVTDPVRQEGWDDGEVYTLQTADHKLIVHSSGDHEYFDLLQDPRELHNLFDGDDEEHRALVRRAVRRYRRLVKDGEGVGSGEINQEYVQELKALGYL